MAIYLIKDEELETSKTSDELSEDELKGVSGGGFTVNKEKTCPSCQSRIPANATECPVCGGKAITQNKLKTCPSCGKTFSKEMNACPHCGMRIKLPTM